jgi:hypothetical protein
MMTQIVIPVPPTSDTPRLQLNIHIQAEILSAEVVLRQANVWLLENVGNLLRAELPELVLGDQLIWRLDIVLTSPTRGSVGSVGRLEVDATTGEILADETLAQEFIPRAQALTAN